MVVCVYTLRGSVGCTIEAVTEGCATGSTVGIGTGAGAGAGTAGAGVAGADGFDSSAPISQY